MQHIPGVEAVGNGAVQSVFPDEIEHAPLQGIDLIIDKNIARTGQGEQQLEEIMKVEPTHTPSVVLAELNMKFHRGQLRGLLSKLVQIAAAPGAGGRGEVGGE